MEAKINIAEIMKNKPQGTKLYSPIFGNLRYEDLVPGSINLKSKEYVVRSKIWK